MTEAECEPAACCDMGAGLLGLLSKKPPTGCGTLGWRAGEPPTLLLLLSKRLMPPAQAAVKTPAAADDVGGVAGAGARPRLLRFEPLLPAEAAATDDAAKGLGDCALAASSNPCAFASGSPGNAMRGCCGTCAGPGSGSSCGLFGWLAAALRAAWCRPHLLPA